MREHKYRCWDEDHFIFSDDKWENEYPNNGDGWFGFEKGILKAWVSITITPSDPFEPPYPDAEELDSPVEESTGLKDIWQGDIVKTYDVIKLERGEQSDYTGIVSWSEKSLAWVLIDKQGKFLEMLCRIEQPEVIGTIHDNPEPK